MSLAYETSFGRCYLGKAEELDSNNLVENMRGSIDLILTSPPFPLNRKKKYGNLQGQEYIDWLVALAPMFRQLLKPNGSIVMELGNVWEYGRPVMSTLPLKALLTFLEKGEFVLCQQFVWNNVAKLPSPAQWVNVERIRVKDSFTHIWWMSATDRPKANNRKVLTNYSNAMQQLLKTQKYNHGTRPSEHSIGKTSFLQDNRGAIPSNVITMANTQANTLYHRYCRALDLKLHPARMPLGLAKFFVQFLTEPGDFVLDPFAGSNTTGQAAEELGRRWIAIEPNQDYVAGSKGRFLTKKEIVAIENEKKVVAQDSSQKI